MFYLQEVYNDFINPENSGNKIGLFRIICAVLGGLLLAYLSMTVVAILTPSSISVAIIIPILFYTSVWACIALWISLAPSKLIAFYRVLIPALIFSTLIFLFYRS